MKMKTAYEQNPSMGDPNSVEGQLKENSHKMDKLQAELRKFVGFQDEMDNGLKPNTPNVQKKLTNRNSISEDSLSRSASDSSFCHNQQQNQSKIRDSVTSQNFINHNHNNTATTNNHNNHEIINRNNSLQPPQSPTKTNG